MKANNEAQWQNLFNNSVGSERRILEIASDVADRIDSGLDSCEEDPGKALSHALAAYVDECSLLDFSQVLVILGQYWKNSEERLQLTFLETLVLMEGWRIRSDALSYQAKEGEG